MEILITIAIVLWIYSSYLYHTSKFKGAYTQSTFEGSIEEQELIEHIHKLKVLPPLLARLRSRYFFFFTYYGKPDEPVFSPDYDRTPDFTTVLKPSGQFMSVEAKRNYLLSPEWQKLRTQVFTRDNYTCQSCGSNESLNCHHIVYDRLGKENISDLTTLCTNCHTTLHKRLGYDRTTLYPIIKD